jgi:hypothetical protein
MALLTDWNLALKWPFVDSVFTACIFNFGPQAVTCSHLNFGNLAWDGVLSCPLAGSMQIEVGI